MFIRQDLDTTIADLEEILVAREDNEKVDRVTPDQIGFHFDSANPMISMGGNEFPATDKAVVAVGNLLQIPEAATKRMVKNLNADVLNSFFSNYVNNVLRKEAKVTSRNGFLEGFEEWHESKASVKPIDIVRAASRVIDPTAPLARLVDTPQQFSFDTYAPAGFEHGYGSDGVTAYADGNERDDVTAGGLRWDMNLKQGLVPTVQSWLYRLACTNGYEAQDLGLKVDARGQSVEEVIAALEEKARIAFGNVEEEISHFYELKGQKVANAERAITQIARERGIPDRSTMALVRLAAGEEMPDEPSMFDVVNLVTNFANSLDRDGARLILERAGGAVIVDHAARCGHCAQKVTS